MKTKLKAHLWTLPRWFATPLFVAPAVLGGSLSGRDDFQFMAGCYRNDPDYGRRAFFQ